MTFYYQVERWRNLVRNTLKTLYTSSINPPGLTISEVEDIILALIQKESSGYEGAVGDGGDSVGLMQLNYRAGTPQDVGYTGSKQNLFDPATNIFYGTKYFLRQLQRYGNLDRAILAYNAGSYRTTETGQPINQSYLDAVLSYLFVEKKTSQPPFSSPSDSHSSTTAPESHTTEIPKRRWYQTIIDFILKRFT